MGVIRFFKEIIEMIKDPNRNFSERVFVALTIAAEIAIAITLLGNIIIGENKNEIIALIIMVVLIPLVTLTCLYNNKISWAVKLMTTVLVPVSLPFIFFLGGGVEGGGILWFIFAFMYIGLVISGVWRNIMIFLLIAISAGCYMTEYFYPEYVYQHTREVFYLDSFISQILVGMLCFSMVMFQNRIFQSENKKAKGEARTMEELNVSQNRFFSSMSHEIRTPINSILGLNELILRDESASDETINDANGIQASGKLLLALINDILDFSKIKAGRMDVIPVDYNVGQLLSEIVNMIWIKATEKGLDFDVSIDPSVPSILHGDEIRIKQILINLLNNAVKYTKEGAIGIHIDSVNAGEKDILLKISVSDTGMGIGKESIPYLFDAFKRFDEKNNRMIEGTGLGLSIVKQLVDLMEGDIGVNSIYGEGTTFNVTIKQRVSDPAAIGELNIHNYGKAKRAAYESSFIAPEAAILIVDDNEMNLSVEKRLLAGTKMRTDTAASGRDALRLTLRNKYDVILMDHLMPEMDGIECLGTLRSQTGGLNRTTPVIVLTANAGSENREMYSRAGFDGYLVKPVSGEALENMLLKHIPADKLNILSSGAGIHEDISMSSRHMRKMNVVVTCSSMCDIPDALIEKLHIQVIPFTIHTAGGIFKDGAQMGADELIRYMENGGDVESEPPEVKDYIDFFADKLKGAYHLIHIAITSSMSKDYKRSSEAARSFENVTVVNSECLSSAAGLLVLIASRLIQQDIRANDIVRELEQVKKRLRCSFILRSTEYMNKKGYIGTKLNKAAQMLELHPSISIRNDKAGISGGWIGKTEIAYKNYIRKAFPVDVIPDSDIVFITYADIPNETLLWIREEIKKYAYFENVVFQQASAAITSNCGPGTFGILYFIKSNRSYNIASLFPKNFIDSGGVSWEDDTEETDISADFKSENILTDYMQQEYEDIVSSAKEEEKEAFAWYENIEGIDGGTGIKYSGSEDAFKTVLKLFYDSIDTKAKELENLYASEDIENYTIKVHALKSSAKLIGAAKLSDAAYALETAGKEKNVGYIKEHHNEFMKQYESCKAALAPLYEAASGDESNDEDTRPVADSYLLEGLYEVIREAASEFDCDPIEKALEEISEYLLPEEEKGKIEQIKDLADKFDYDGICELLKKGE